jgi:hypothetical protein
MPNEFATGCCQVFGSYRKRADKGAAAVDLWDIEDAGKQSVPCMSEV